MNTLLRIAFFFAALLPVAALASGFSVTVTSCRQPLTFNQAPQRAVINDLNMTEMAFALQLQPAIVGATGISGWYKTTPAFQALRGEIPELAPKYPTQENLLAVHPDFFFAGWNYGMKVGGGVTPATLARYGIKTLVLSESCIHIDPHQPRASMDLLYRDMLTLGSIFGKRELEQHRVDAWQAQLAEIARRIGHRPQPGVFVYDSGEDKPFTSGKYAMPTAIIAAAGGRNILDDLPMSWGTTSWETVAASQPAFIILLDYQASGSAATLRRFLESHPLMRLTPAVRQQRYLALPYQALTPGPANIDAVQALARALSGCLPMITSRLGYVGLLCLVAALVVGLMLLGIIAGTVRLPLSQVIAALTGRAAGVPEMVARIVIDLRVPRSLLAGETVARSLGVAVVRLRVEIFLI